MKGAQCLTEGRQACVRTEPGVCTDVVMVEVAKGKAAFMEQQCPGTFPSSQGGKVTNSDWVKPVKIRKRRKEITATKSNINCKYQVQ